MLFSKKEDDNPNKKRRQEVDGKTLLWVVNKTPKGVKAWKCMKFIFSMNIMDFSVSAILLSRIFLTHSYYSVQRGRLLLKMEIYNHACHYRMNLMLNWWRSCFFNYKRIYEYLYGILKKICELYLWMNELISILFCVSVSMRIFSSFLLFCNEMK